MKKQDKEKTMASGHTGPTNPTPASTTPKPPTTSRLADQPTSTSKSSDITTKTDYKLKASSSKDTPSFSALSVSSSTISQSNTDISYQPTLSLSKSSTTVISSSSAASTNSSVPSSITNMGMKHSKSDHSSLSGGSRKDKSSSKEKKAPAMGKKCMSQSQDNLTNNKKSTSGASRSEKHQKQEHPTQVKMVIEPSPRPKQASSTPAPLIAANSTTTTSSTSGKSIETANKENHALKERGRNNGDMAIFVKPKPVKGTPMKNVGFGPPGNLRKASSTQSIDKTSHSTNGNGSIKSSSSSKSFNNMSAIKRAQSTQNISKDKFTKKRTSAPADVMAYNAELLANFEKEKKVLEVRISELTKIAEGRKVEIEKCKYEVKRLKSQCSNSVAEKDQLELLKQQNKQLNDRLLELGFPAEHITDNEKLILKMSASSSPSQHGSVPVKIPQGSSSDTCLPTSASYDSLSTDGGAVGACGGCGVKSLHRSSSVSNSEPGMSLEDYCGTPDHPSVLSFETASTHWEKQSNKSANSDGGNSEVSVACLTERILQMEETNYSTAEELQATLQELGDLQDTVNELTDENGCLNDEKTVLLESLCAQTEKLEKTRIQLEQLKCLLISGELPEKSEMDGHLRGLLKSAAEEREELMRKQAEWSNALEGLEMECKETQEAGEALREKYTHLEATNNSLRADLDASEGNLAVNKKELEAEKIEVVRLKTLLETERKKVSELETARMAQDKTDVETLLDAARRDKAQVEEKLANANEGMAKSQCEITRLKDVLASKDQEIIVLRNNSYEERGKLQYEMEEGKKEYLALVEEMKTLRKHAEEVEEECDRLGIEKKSIGGKMQELQNELKNCLQQKLIIEAEMQEMRCKHDTESEEWNQFQKDLQMAVVIATNFNQETKKSMETLNDEKSILQEQVNNLRSEVDRLRDEVKVAKQCAMEESPTGKYPILTNSELKGNVSKVLNLMDRDLVALREKNRGPASSPLDQRSQSISVKSLIRSIEEQVKSGCSSRGQSSHSESRRSSTSSDISLSSLKELVTSPLATPDSPHSPSKDFALRTASLRVSTASTSSNKPPRERSPQTPNMTAWSSTTSCSPVSTNVNNLISCSTSGNNSGAVGISGEIATCKSMGVYNGTNSSIGAAGGSLVYSPPTNRLEAGGDAVVVSGSGASVGNKVSYPISSILKDRSTPRRNSTALEVDVAKKETPGKDPLASLAKLMKGSKRNALLKWCQMKTIPYTNVDITNFSSSWNDGLAFCALLHCLVPQKIPYSELNSEDKMRNFSLAFKVGESIGIKSNLNINDMVCMERPDWQAVMSYVTSIYKHFELDRQ